MSAPGYGAPRLAVVAAAYVAFLLMASVTVLAELPACAWRALAAWLDRIDPPSGGHAAIPPDTPAPAPRPVQVPAPSPLAQDEAATPPGVTAAPLPLPDLPGGQGQHPDTWVGWQDPHGGPLPARPTERPPWGPATEPVQAAPDPEPYEDDDTALPVRVAAYADPGWRGDKGMPNGQRLHARARAAAMTAASARACPGWDSALVRRRSTAATQAMTVIA